MSVGTNYTGSTSTTYQREQQAKADAASGKVSHSDFLKLLTTQLTNQDPLNPMQDMDFTGQLAQLQALEEQIAMTKSMQAMRLDSQIQAGTAMINKFIQGTDINGEEANGQVKRVSQIDGNVTVELYNGQKVEVSNINNIWNDASSMYEEIANSGNVIGKWVEAGYDSESKQPIRGIVEKVMVEEGQVKLKLYGGSIVTWDQVTELRAPTTDEELYMLPDEVRQKMEQASEMFNRGVTGKDTNGNTVNGIVAGAVPDGEDVYLILYSGELIKMEDVIGDARKPTAEDAAKSLDGLWVIGTDVDGNESGGKVVGAEDREGDIVLKLSTGKEVLLDKVTTIRQPTAEEEAGS
ncbi:MAG: hypothetical protein LIP23_05955 [Planctomycetes bacterium]|nr:hypothetical protein [Planctomycetota bacterium]